MMRQIIRGAAVSGAAACLLAVSSFPALAEEEADWSTDVSIDLLVLDDEVSGLNEQPEGEGLEEDTVGAGTVINQCVVEQDALVLGLAPGDPGGLPLLSLGLNVLNEYYCIGNTVEVHNHAN